MVCDFNDILWDFNAMLWNLYAMKNWYEELIIYYALLCYAMKFKQKRLSLQKSSKYFKQMIISQSLPLIMQCDHYLKKKHILNWVKSLCYVMLALWYMYDMIWQMQIYESVQYAIVWDSNAIIWYLNACYGVCCEEYA